MHELTLVTSLCARAEAAAHQAGAEQVTALSIRLGALTHLSPELLRDHLARASAGSILEGARVDVTVGTDPSAPGAQDIELLNLQVR